MDNRVTTAGRERSPKQPWQPPRITRLRADAAENGRLLGPEALILLS